jgi:hypothetical protein
MDIPRPNFFIRRQRKPAAVCWTTVVCCRWKTPCTQFRTAPSDNDGPKWLTMSLHTCDTAVTFRLRFYELNIRRFLGVLCERILRNVPCLTQARCWLNMIREISTISLEAATAVLLENGCRRFDISCLHLFGMFHPWKSLQDPPKRLSPFTQRTQRHIKKKKTQILEVWFVMVNYDH